MAYRKAFGSFIIVMALTIWSSSASASSDVIEKVQAFLYAGKTWRAETVVRARLAEAPDDDQARFALGAVQFLQAIEHLGQSLHRYGLSTGYHDPTGMSGLPFLRIPIPENPNPEKVTYEGLRGVLRALIVDLETAERTLSSVKNQAIDFPLNIGYIHLDLNGDGAASGDEALWRIFKRVAGLPWLNEEEAAKFQTDFDKSDVPWLRAYSHLLMAIAEFPLAHDWRDAFETTFHGLFPKAGLPSSALDEIYAETLAELAKLGAPPIWPRRQPGEDRNDFRERYKKWRSSPEGEKSRRINSLRSQVQFGGIADLIAFVHLNHWPVVEPARMRRVLEHLEAMVRLSRENWRRINSETDNRNEWIPSPKQSGVLPRMRVTEDRVAGWMLFLNEFGALLEGKKLLPHWRFDRGINLRRMFLEPSTFDIVLLIQGSAALPYLEEGELTSEETWRQMTAIFGGEFFRYFIWFN